MELLKRFGRPKVGLEYEYTNINNGKNFNTFLDKEARKVIKNQLKKMWKQQQPVKIWIDVNVIFRKLETSVKGPSKKYVRSRTYIGGQTKCVRHACGHTYVVGSKSAY